MRKKSLLLAVLLAVAGFCVLLWPVFTGHRLQANTDEAAQSFLEERKPEQQHPELLAALQDYNQRIYAEKQSDLTSLEACEEPAVDLAAYGVEDGIIGVLEIPALKLTLPVAGDWSYALLDLAPCRYAGSAYLDDLVILGHNYRGFFRDLSQLQPGDTVFFTDTDGNRFSYAVSDFEQLRPPQTKDMLAGDWDLTLFTCTPGAQNRLAVRCLRSDP